MKGIWKEKTTWVALFGVAGFIVLLVMLIVGKLSATDFGIAVGAFGGFIATLVGFFASDRGKGVDKSGQ